MTRSLVLAGRDAEALRAVAACARPASRFRVHVVASGLDALAAASAERPDLVVLDESLGFDQLLGAVDALRGDSVCAAVPVLAIVDDRATGDAAIARGATDVIIRPFDGAECARRIEILTALGESRLRLAELTGDEVLRGREHAARLETLWRIGSSALDDDAFLRALLDESSRAMREHVLFNGLIGHLDGPDLVVDVVQDDGGIPTLRPGTRVPIGDAIAGVILREGRTCAWTDLRADPRVAGKRIVRTAPWRALIGTPFRAGGTLHVIMFFAAQPLHKEFDAHDRAYVETLASFCAARLQQRIERERMRYQVEHDPLTGVLNRPSFRARSFSALRDGGRSALVVVDLDNFRDVNEALGPQGGDSVLVEIAGALMARAGEDAVARVAGDSFALLMRGVGDRADVERRLAPYVEVFSAPFRTGDRDASRTIGVTATFGIAIAPDDGTTFEHLLARAESATLAAKQAGRGRHEFFDPRVEERLALARRLQNDLAQALVRDELQLYFQPHVDLHSRRTVGAEALLRWNHPERGLLRPAEFLPFAEGYGMLGAIGSWVMRETIDATRLWRRADASLRVWFNLSASDLSDPQFVMRLHDFDGDLDGIGVEITEAVAMRDVELTQRSVASLRDAGVRVALDDFGTGYSSLAHLKRLPIDVVKIDGAFVAGLPHDAHDAAIVDAVVGIGERFGFEVIAECVETSEQARWLTDAGCGYGQGYRFAPPMPATMFDEWLRATPETPGLQRRT